MLNYKPRYLFILIIAITFSQLPAQPTNLRFDQISLDKGLSQSSIYAIEQDSLGFIWFGTQDGLNRYDGYSIKVFRHDPADSNSISDNTVWSLLSDNKGDLWIGTERGGLDRYVVKENKFYHYEHNEFDTLSLSENYITSIFEDSHGNLWIGTNNNGLNLLIKGKNKFKHFLQHQEKNTISIGSNIRNICEDKNGYLWIATEGGCYNLKLNESVSLMERTFSLSNYDSLINLADISSKSNRSIYCDQDGLVWIGTWGGGINCFNESTRNIQQFKHSIVNSSSISGNLITSIYQTLDGSFWIGTYDGGLNIYNMKTSSFKSYIKTENVITLFEDKSGILWIGTLANGLKTYDKRKNKFINYYNDPNKLNTIQGKQILAILMDRDGELWVGTGDNGLNRFDKDRKNIINYTFDSKKSNSITSNQVYALCESSEGTIWVGTLVGGLNRFDKKTNRFIHYRHDPKNSNSILTNNITALHCDKNENNLWIGYADGGVSLLNIPANMFKHYEPNKNQPGSISSSSVTVIYGGKQSGLWIGTLNRGLNHFLKGTNSFRNYQVVDEFESNNKFAQLTNASINNNGITSIYEDDQGIIWIGTFNGGLNRYEPKTESFKYYTTKSGLPNDVVYGILPDKSGNLWLSTNRGLSKFNPSTEKFRNFDINDGLQSNEFNWGAYYNSPSGELFFGGVNGFNSFFPGKIDTNKFIPPIYLTSFRVFNEKLPFPDPIPNGTKIELNYSQNFFTFEFVALNFTASEKNQYAYYLEGFDKFWHFVSAQQRYASYTNLDPGEYILHIKASNNDNLWNANGTSITIIISPPFWMTWWFRGISILIVLSIGVGIYNYRVKQILRIERMRVHIAADLHDEIGSSVGSIVLRSRVLQRDKSMSDKSREELGKIYRTAMQTTTMMRDIVWFVNPDFDKVDDMILRMKDTAQMLLGNIPYDFISPEEIVSTKLSLEFRRNIFLSYKEILHNISKHSNATKVEIETNIHDGIFYLEVTDNGIGFDYNSYEKETKFKTVKRGLKNIKHRLREIEGQIEVKSAIGKGTRIKLEVRTT